MIAIVADERLPEMISRTFAHGEILVMLSAVVLRWSPTFYDQRYFKLRSLARGLKSGTTKGYSVYLSADIGSVHTTSKVKLSTG